MTESLDTTHPNKAEHGLKKTILYKFSFGEIKIISLLTKGPDVLPNSFSFTLFCFYINGFWYVY